MFLHWSIPPIPISLTLAFGPAQYSLYVICGLHFNHKACHMPKNNQEQPCIPPQVAEIDVNQRNSELFNKLNMVCIYQLATFQSFSVYTLQDYYSWFYLARSGVTCPDSVSVLLLLKLAFSADSVSLYAGFDETSSFDSYDSLEAIDPEFSPKWLWRKCDKMFR